MLYTGYIPKGGVNSLVLLLPTFIKSKGAVPSDYCKPTSSWGYLIYTMANPYKAKRSSDYQHSVCHKNTQCMVPHIVQMYLLSVRKTPDVLLLIWNC